MRLLASYLAVVVVGAATLYTVSRMIVPGEFQRRLRLSGQGRGPGGTGPSAADLGETVVDAVDTALLIGVAVAVVTAGIVALLVSGRLLRPIDGVRDAAAAMARGDYNRRVPIPVEEELAALAHDVNTLAATLDATESRRTQLIGEVAHELRTPLTTIGGYMEALLDGVREPDPETFAAVAEETARLRRLADDLTLLSQAEEGALPMALAPVDLGDLAAGAADRLRLQFEHRKVALEVSAHHAIVNADSDRLTQVLVNLLGNALIHTPEGGGVSLRSGTSSGTGWVEIADSGRGIPPEELEHIFERFYRIPNPDHKAGRGIGLTIARSIARAHGGDITATSEGLGRGATFRVTLPAAGGTPPPRSAAGILDRQGHDR